MFFTFAGASGIIAAAETSDIQEIRPYQFCVIPAKLTALIRWNRRANIIVVYWGGTSRPNSREPMLVVDDLRPVMRRDRCLAHLVHAILAVGLEGARATDEFVTGLGCELMVRTFVECLRPSEPEPSPRVGLPVAALARISDHVDANLGSTIRTRDLARKIGLSPDHFARRFKLAVRVTPKEFVLRRKVEKVRELLESGNYNVTEAAEKVGFHDLSHLNRCFRRFYDCSPREVLRAAIPTVSYKNRTDASIDDDGE